ncbi:MAG: hypothetical protein NT132_08705 [Microbacterium sp.]|uniref:hypothetical protein n=1 Tax=Microbacterium sp. TaxID=51671 RepID=UPI0026042F6E|nr:hypothetical protein [Microbacterium sp.]MCX6502467.1 hypothetical protein [Microbacterium sp.]
MDEMQTSHPTARYTAVAWVSAVLIGVAAGIALGFLLRDAWAGAITGVVVVVLIGFSAVLAARPPETETGAVRLADRRPQGCQRSSSEAVGRATSGPERRSTPPPAGRRMG